MTSELRKRRKKHFGDGIPNWSLETWQTLYSTIRRCNLFIANVEKAPFDNKAMLGEVKSLRTWCYFNLTNLYRGMPIISKVYELTDEFTAPRDSYKACINFIVGNLYLAARLLPVVQCGNNNRRATNAMFVEPGIDSRSGPNEPNNSGQTLYLVRKFLDPKVLPSAGTRQAVSWRFIRYAEVRNVQKTIS